MTAGSPWSHSPTPGAEATIKRNTTEAERGEMVVLKPSREEDKTSYSQAVQIGNVPMLIYRANLHRKAKT